MKCVKHQGEAVLLCLKRKCDYRLLCQICFEENHSNHQVTPISRLKDIIMVERLEQDHGDSFTSTVASLQGSLQSFIKVGRFLDTLQQQICARLKSTVLDGELTAQDQVSKSQVCNDLCLSMTDGQLSFKESEATQYARSFRELSSVVLNFQGEIFEEVRQVGEKMHQFEKLVQEQIAVLTQSFINSPNKPLQSDQMNCSLCSYIPEVSFDGRLVWDHAKRDVIHEECYMYANTQPSAEETCQLCNKAYPYIKCAECNKQWHYSCIIEHPEHIFMNPFEQKITCLNHIDKFFLKRIKQEQAESYWRADQVESKSYHSDMQEEADQPEQAEAEEASDQQQESSPAANDPIYDTPLKEQHPSGQKAFFKTCVSGRFSSVSQNKQDGIGFRTRGVRRRGRGRGRGRGRITQSRPIRDPSYERGSSRTRTRSRGRGISRTISRRPRHEVFQSDESD